MTVKRTISLPASQDRRVQAIAKRRKTPYSALVQAALEILVELDEKGQLDRAYREYYAQPENVSRVGDLVAEYRALSEKAWS